jgi:hypothetical protein
MSAPLSENTPTGQPPERVSIAKSHPVLLMVTIGLGIAIVVVLALMVGLVVKRASEKAAAPLPAAGAPVPAPQMIAKPAAPVATTIMIKRGTALADARLDGGVLILRTVGGEADEVITLDPKTGQVLARVTLRKSDGP